MPCPGANDAASVVRRYTAVSAFQVRVLLLCFLIVAMDGFD
ncbi:hypothetical protein, partial [Pseudomonas paraeruginosa]